MSRAGQLLGSIAFAALIVIATIVVVTSKLGSTSAAEREVQEERLQQREEAREERLERLEERRESRD